MLFLPRELPLILELFKLPKITRKGLVTALSRRHLDVTYRAAIPKIQDAVLKKKDDTELETCKKIYF